MWLARATVGRQSSRCVCHLGGFFFAAITTWISDRGRKLTDSRVRHGRAVFHSEKHPATTGVTRPSRRDAALVSERSREHISPVARPLDREAAASADLARVLRE